MRLICGYRRTGKDTLYQQLNKQGEIPFNWRVYAAPEADHASQLAWLHQKGPRAAFADELKRQVQDRLKHAGVIFDYEAEKDTRVFEFEGRKTTYRQECIDHGRRRREEDKDYWARIVLRQGGIDTIITDFRFPNEYAFIKEHVGDVLTIRVFRGEVPIPPAEELSEHSLDPFTADLLLVVSDRDLEEACKLFPQYRTYIRIE